MFSKTPSLKNNMPSKHIHNQKKGSGHYLANPLACSYRCNFGVLLRFQQRLS